MVQDSLTKLLTALHFLSAVDKRNLYPSTPPLTRYKETTFPIVKKKLGEHLILDNEINKKLNELTTPTLCIRLNTFRVSEGFHLFLSINNFCEYNSVGSTNFFANYKIFYNFN